MIHLNKYIKWGSLIILLILQGACTKDFLNLNPEATTNLDDFYTNEDEVKQAVNGAYNILMDLGRSSFWEVGEMRSDNTTFQYNTIERGRQPREFIDQFLTDASAEPIATFWQQSFIGIARCNDVLSNIDRVEMSEESKIHYKAEVYFLRALHYFNLVRQYGGVPIRLSPAESPEDALSKGRASIAEVYEVIVNDLTTSATYFASVAAIDSEKGRASEGAARTLLAKVYSTLGNFKDAIPELRRVTEMGYILLPNYGDNFLPELKNGKESIFEIQYLGAQPSLSSNFMYQFAPYTSGSAVTGDPQTPLAGGSGWNIPTQDMIDAYEKGDLRKPVSLKEGYTDSEGNFVKIPYVNKYNHGFAERGQTDDNFPYLRYADVVLMLAEALNEQGFVANGEAFDLLNSVRERAGLPAKTSGNAKAVLNISDQQAFRDAIFQERRVELAFENHRWYDLVRSGKVIEVMNEHGRREKQQKTTIPANAYNLTQNRLLLQIPQIEVTLDGLEQNPQ